MSEDRFNVCIVGASGKLGQYMAQHARWDESGRIPADWVRIDRRIHQADQPPSTMTFAPVT
jgi:hypothetical protein